MGFYRNILDAFNTGLGLLTIQQKTQGMTILTGLMNDLGGPSQANVTLNKVIPPVWKIVSPLADKVSMLLYYQLLIPLSTKKEIVRKNYSFKEFQIYEFLRIFQKLVTFFRKYEFC